MILSTSQFICYVQIFVIIHYVDIIILRYLPLVEMQQEWLHNLWGFMQNKMFDKIIDNF